MAYIIGTCTATNNVGTNYTTLGDGAELSGTVQGGYGTMKLICISTGGSVQSGGLYLAFATSATPGTATSFIPCYKYGSLYYPYGTTDTTFSNKSYTQNGVYHYKGSISYTNLYTIWSFDVCIFTTVTIVTVVAPKGGTLTINPAGKSVGLFNATTVNAGTSAEIVIPGTDAEITISSTLTSGYTLKSYTINGVSQGSSATYLHSVVDGDVISAKLTKTITITIKAPSAGKVSYVISRDGSYTDGTVNAGQSKSVSLSDVEMAFAQLSLTFTPTNTDFDLARFGGWTKDGEVVERYANPASLQVEGGETVSCEILSEPAHDAETEYGNSSHKGRILYGKSGFPIMSTKGGSSASYAILYADKQLTMEEGDTLVDGKICRIYQVSLKLTMTNGETNHYPQITITPLNGGTLYEGVLTAKKSRASSVELTCEIAWEKKKIPRLNLTGECAGYSQCLFSISGNVGLHDISESYLTGVFGRSYRCDQ